MSADLKLENLHPLEQPGHLNEEWVELVNGGDAPFNMEGCSITVARSSGARPRNVTTMKAGVVIQPGERVRLVSGSSGKKSHGTPPPEDLRNVHLFLKAPYLDHPGTIVRIVNRQHELCRATLAPS